MKKAMKYTVLSAGMILSSGLGDYLDVNDRIVYPFIYREKLVDQGTYQDPFNLKKRYVTNDKGFLEVQLGNGKEYHPVGRDMEVNCKGIEGIVRHGNILGRVRSGAKKIMHDIKSWYMDGLK